VIDPAAVSPIRPLRVRHLALAVALLSCLPAMASADWTTYRGDAARSGVDTSSTGSVPFVPAWTSPNLGGGMWAQPLVHDGLVIAATDSDELVALDESTGQVVWQASTGTPVPSGDLPCGDVAPTVGITSTPVIDPATNEVFAVADTLNGQTIEHELYAFNVSTGASVAGFPVDVEPPGDTPADQLQRAALALDNGEIVIGYGGNYGTCSPDHGWLIGVPEAGGAEQTFEVDATVGDLGGIWGSGDGPAIDSGGDIWAATGNGNSGSSYGYQEAVLKLGPSLNVLDYWAPSNWESLDAADLDIGSGEPLLLPNDLVFQIGKAGVGYLLSASHLGGEGASPAYQAQVCSGSWGGAIYYGGIIYVTCADGLRALALNASAPSFSPLASWQVTSSAAGPPTVAGGLVWATDAGTNDGTTLYGFNPQTGQVVVQQTTPAMEHFATPSASDGKLFLATGASVEAYTIANPIVPPISPPSGAAAGPGSNRCTLTLRSQLMKIHHPKRGKHQTRAPAPYGTIALAAKCRQRTKITLSATVTDELRKKRSNDTTKIHSFHPARIRATLAAGVARTLQLRLSDSVLAQLAHATKRAGTFTLSAPGVHVVVKATRLRL